MRVLVVDDDYVSRTQLKALLSKYGDCDAVPNGNIALEMLRISHDEGVPYDLITLDIEMPDMSGHEVVKRIRNWEEANGVIQEERESKILMVSAMKDGGSILTSFREGCEGYIVKPVTPAKLIEALQKFDII